MAEGCRAKNHMAQIGLRVGKIIADVKKSALCAKSKNQLCNDFYVITGMLGTQIDKFLDLRAIRNNELKTEKRKKSVAAQKAKAKPKCGVKPATKKRQTLAPKAGIKTTPKTAGNKKARAPRKTSPVRR